MGDTWGMVKAEREDLAQLLESLTPEQWDTQSLCSEWKVRDVVAHLISATESPMGFMGPLVTSGFNYNKASAKDAKRRGSVPPAELLKDFRTAIPSERTPPFTKPITLLADTMVHAQDIRRPLGISRQIPADRFRQASEYAKGVGFPMGTKKRIAGLTLKATDMDWSTGSGPVVEGTGEALLMMMGGRKSALDDLSGEGKPTLASRF